MHVRGPTDLLKPYFPDFVSGRGSVAQHVKTFSTLVWKIH